ncbi:hypothetical protein [Legionella sp. PC997]|uniref:hypothetical protein n=1 Tax=Legionella sp. PC997 TaxID=2755562 RepID=UPI0015FD6C50|nr:hypothetical protein [Legionella sp. PC997]QMT61833.1 hypothetical protein HBNCFIEN_03240 [Legionella sp. PC997]
MLVYKKIALINIMISIIFFLYGCSSDNKQDNFYVYAEINQEKHLCFMKKGFHDEKYEGELSQHGEKIVNCHITLPPQFKDKYRMCVLSGIRVDGQDRGGQMSLHGWSCDVSSVTGSVTMYMKSTATYGVVSCSMLCIKN